MRLKIIHLYNITIYWYWRASYTMMPCSFNVDLQKYNLLMNVVDRIFRV